SRGMPPHAAAAEQSTAQRRAVEACRKGAMAPILLGRPDNFKRGPPLIGIKGVRLEGPCATRKQTAPASLSGDAGRFGEPHRRARSLDVLCGTCCNPGERQAGGVVGGRRTGLVASL